MFSDPLKNLKAFGLRENDIVADLGAGTGHYALAMGPLVPAGKIYAIELQKDFLDTIKSRVDERGLHNIEIIWGDVEKIGGTKINTGIVDAVIVSNVLFQVADKTTLIDEVKRILKPGGRVLLIDWAESSVLSGTSIISKDDARIMFEKKGFALEREINAGDYHYGIILIKS